jgi:hypothetical protein
MTGLSYQFADNFGAFATADLARCDGVAERVNEVTESGEYALLEMRCGQSSREVLRQLRWTTGSENAARTGPSDSRQGERKVRYLRRNPLLPIGHSQAEGGFRNKWGVILG